MTHDAFERWLIDVVTTTISSDESSINNGAMKSVKPKSGTSGKKKITRKPLKKTVTIEPETEVETATLETETEPTTIETEPPMTKTTISSDESSINNDQIKSEKPIDKKSGKKKVIRKPFKKTITIEPKIEVETTTPETETEPTMTETTEQQETQTPKGRKRGYSASNVEITSITENEKTAMQTKQQGVTNNTKNIHTTVKSNKTRHYYRNLDVDLNALILNVGGINPKKHPSAKTIKPRFFDSPVYE